MIEKRCEGSNLEFFLNCIKEWLSTDSHGKLIVKTAPSCYDPPHHDLLQRCYTNTGFTPVRTLANHFIFPGCSNFCDIIRPNEKRRLKKAQVAGFENVETSTIVPGTAVEFLLQCHRKNGYRLSLLPLQLDNLLRQFPDHFILFAAADRGKIIALAITVRISRHILYYFTSAFLPEYSTFSPMVLLLNNIYGFCQQNGIQLLDLGTSLDHEGNFKPPLARFKENIGGNVCQKITYELIF